MTVFLVDDHSLFRAGIALLLSDLIGESAVREFSRLSPAMDALRSGDVPTLLLLDLHMPGENGMDGLEQMKEVCPALPIIVLSSDDRRETILTALERGASGFVPKSSSTSALESALRLALAGELYVPREAIAGGPFPEGGEPLGCDFPSLTERELDVLDCLLRGMSNKQICRALGMAEPTARQHTKAVFEALNVRTRAQVITEAVKRGIRLR